MMLWRSQQYDEEKTLLTEYLAVRLSLEWALIQSYLPIQQQQMENQIPLEHANRKLDSVGKNVHSRLV